MYKISKEFHCCSSHSLQGLPQNHPCSKLHGHNYVIKVELKSEKLNDVGFIKDYRELKPIKEFIDNVMDHEHLNDTLDIDNPTAENIAKYLFDIFKTIVSEISAVEVSETPKTNARYEP